MIFTNLFRNRKALELKPIIPLPVYKYTPPVYPGPEYGAFTVLPDLFIDLEYHEPQLGYFDFSASGKAKIEILDEGKVVWTGFVNHSTATAHLRRKKYIIRLHNRDVCSQDIYVRALI